MEGRLPQAEPSPFLTVGSRSERGKTPARSDAAPTVLCARRARPRPQSHRGHPTTPTRPEPALPCSRSGRAWHDKCLLPTEMFRFVRLLLWTAVVIAPGGLLLLPFLVLRRRAVPDLGLRPSSP